MTFRGLKGGGSGTDVGRWQGKLEDVESLAVLRRWRLALFAFLFAIGVGFASWVTRTPAIRDGIEVTTAGMGLVLFGLSIGSMTGILSSGPAVRRFGSRPVIASGVFLLPAGLAGMAAGTALAAPLVVFAGLIAFGLGMGLTEIALNIDGAHVESRMQRPVLPAMHGFFSLGTFVGAVGGIVLTASGTPVVLHVVGAAVIVLAVTGWAVSQMPRGVHAAAEESASAEAESDAVPRRSVWRDPALIVLGVAVLAMAFAEGAASDWLPILTVDGLNLSATQGSLMYAAFAALMTIGRFGGQALVTRIPKRVLLLASAATAGVGVALVVLVADPAFAIVGVALWGLGTSLGFPVAISAAGDDPDRPSRRVGAVATFGYIAFLVGPPALGFLGEEIGIRPAMFAVVALLVTATVVLAATLRPRRRAPQPSPSHPGAHSS
jgi:fucose permease